MDIGGGAAMVSREDIALVAMGLMGTDDWVMGTEGRLIGIPIGFTTLDCAMGFMTGSIGLGNDCRLTALRLRSHESARAGACVQVQQWIECVRVCEWREQWCMGRREGETGTSCERRHWFCQSGRGVSKRPSRGGGVRLIAHFPVNYKFE